MGPHQALILVASASEIFLYAPVLIIVHRVLVFLARSRKRASEIFWLNLMFRSHSMTNACRNVHLMRWETKVVPVAEEMWGKGCTQKPQRGQLQHKLAGEGSYHGYVADPLGRQWTQGSVLVGETNANVFTCIPAMKRKWHCFKRPQLFSIFWSIDLHRITTSRRSRCRHDFYVSDNNIVIFLLHAAEN